MQDSKKELLLFLKTQRWLVIATADADPWICNVYYGIADDFKIYFIGIIEEIHSQHIVKNPAVAFATCWFDPTNHTNRKGVQGKGLCFIAESESDIERGVQLHNKYFPEFAQRITNQYIKSDTNKSRVWIILPKVIKFWNDQFYPEKKWEEFHFELSA